MPSVRAFPGCCVGQGNNFDVYVMMWLGGLMRVPGVWRTLWRCAGCVGCVSGGGEVEKWVLSVGETSTCEGEEIKVIMIQRMISVSIYITRPFNTHL